MNQDDLIGFAAIQIFAAMVSNGDYDESRTNTAEARLAWRLAKMLHDARPKDKGDDNG